MTLWVVVQGVKDGFCCEHELQHWEMVRKRRITMKRLSGLAGPSLVS